MDTTLIEKVRRLPPEKQQEVADFVDFLLERVVENEQVRSEERQPTFAWRGALRDLRDQYTSVELQHEVQRRRAQVD